MNSGVSLGSTSSALASSRTGRDKTDQIISHVYIKTVAIVAGLRLGHEPQTRSAKAYKWFNLDIPDFEPLHTELGLWRNVSTLSQTQTNSLTPDLVLEIYLDATALDAQQSLTIGGLTIDDRQVVMERWTLTFAPVNTGSGTAIELSAVYKRAIIAFRRLYTAVLLLPTHKLARQVQKQGLKMGLKWSAAQTSSSLLEPLSNQDKIQHKTLFSLVTPAGVMDLNVAYRTMTGFQVKQEIGLAIDRTPAVVHAASAPNPSRWLEQTELRRPAPGPLQPGLRHKLNPYSASTTFTPQIPTTSSFTPQFPSTMSFTPSLGTLSSPRVHSGPTLAGPVSPSLSGGSTTLRSGASRVRTTSLMDTISRQPDRTQRHLSSSPPFASSLSSRPFTNSIFTPSPLIPSPSQMFGTSFSPVSVRRLSGGSTSAIGRSTSIPVPGSSFGDTSLLRKSSLRKNTVMLGASSDSDRSLKLTFTNSTQDEQEITDFLTLIEHQPDLRESGTVSPLSRLQIDEALAHIAQSAHRATNISPAPPIHTSQTSQHAIPLLHSRALSTGSRSSHELHHSPLALTPTQMDPPNLNQPESESSPVQRAIERFHSDMSAVRGKRLH